MNRKFKIRPREINGVFTTFDWIDDASILEMLEQTEGTPISLDEAANLFYNAVIKEDLSVRQEILALGLIQFVQSLGLRVDIFAELEENKIFS